MPILKHIDFQVPNWGEFTNAPLTRAGYYSLVMAEGPLGYWRLGESSGIVGDDETANNYSGTYDPNSGGVWTGGTLAQPGALVADSDTSADFDGVFGSGLNMGSVLNIGTSDWSVMAWIKTTSSARSVIAAKFNTSSDRGWMLSVAKSGTSALLTGKIAGPSGSITVVDFSTPVNTGQWVFVGMTIDRTGNLILYINGTSVKTQSISALQSDNITSSNTMVIARGVGGYANGLNGLIDEVSVYGQAISPTNMLAIYNAGASI